MKIAGILLLIISSGYTVILYTGQTKEILNEMNDWMEVLSFWKEEISEYGFAVDELGERLYSNPLCGSLALTDRIGGKSMAEILSYVSGENCTLIKTDKERLLHTLRTLGSHLSGTQDKILEESVLTWKKRAETLQNELRQKNALLCKIMPLLCGAVIVLCW